MSEKRIYPPMTIDQIRKFIPHRHPFLLIDRVLEIETPVPVKSLDASDDKVGIRVLAQKNVSYGEMVFPGHFPDYSILPGVMIIESMAQASSFAVYPFLADQLHRVGDFQCILVGVDSARFRRPVTPGDVLRIETVVNKYRKGIWGFACTATVDGQKVAEAEIMANLVTRGAAT